jgi:hypothetical protein
MRPWSDFFLFRFRYRPGRLTTSDSSFGSPRCATLCTLPRLCDCARLCHIARAVLYSSPAVLCRSVPLSPVAVVTVGKGRTVAGQTQKAGGLPIVTKPPDQTKIQVILHVESPTKHYRILCSRCETDWCIWIGLPTLTMMPI